MLAWMDLIGLHLILPDTAPCSFRRVRNYAFYPAFAGVARKGTASSVEVAVNTV